MQSLGCTVVSTRSSTTRTTATTRSTTRITTTTGTSASSISSSSSAPSTSASITEPSTSGCFEDGVYWEPLDIAGGHPFKALDELSCQGACSETQSCSHWSYWEPDGLCHLQGPGATRRSGVPGFRSGPPRCAAGSAESGGGAATSSGESGANASLRRCVEFGAAYSPSMGNPRYFPRAATVTEHRDHVVACLKFCANTTDCAHFTYDIVAGSCKMALASATLARGVPLTVSGPPRCPNGTSEEDAGASPARDLLLAAKAYGDLMEVL